MNSSKKLIQLAVLLVIATLSACSKKDPEPEFSKEIQNIIPESVIEDLRLKGMQVNSGKTPPNIEGIFVVNPLTLLSPYGPEDPWREGKVISDLTYRFYNQTADHQITYDTKSGGGSITGTGKGALIAGTGTEFTIFSEEIDFHSNGISSTRVAVISGEMTPNGMKNLQYAFVMISKTGDDDDSQLMPVNTSRIWYDGNQLAESRTAFRLTQEAQSTTTTQNSSPSSVEKE